MADRAKLSTEWLWILHDAAKPKYTAAQVERLTGASAADLQNWANRGLIKPISNRPGKGGRRLYTKIHVCIIATREWLRPLGVDASYAFDIAIVAVEALNKGIRPKAGELRSDILKFIYNAVALIDIDDERQFRAKIVRATEIQSDLNNLTPILEYAFSHKPGLIVPIGNIVGRTHKADLALDSEAST